MDNFLLWKIQKEDEEMFDLMTAYNHQFSSSSSSQRTPCHTSILRGAMWVKEVLEGHESRSKNEFRMEAHVFHSLVRMLKNKHLLIDGSEIEVEEQVAIFLYTLAKNASNRTVQELFQHSGSVVSKYFGNVLNAVLQLSAQFICSPSLLTPNVISDNTKFYPYFKDCIGAIDGTHVPITVQGRLQDPYRNRKQTLSQNVMVACNFNNRFVYVLSGWEGSASDALVLKSAIDECDFSVPRDKFYLVDAGYANTPSFIAPYRGVRYHLNEQAKISKRPKDYKELFNLRHSQLRNHVERIIGVLKMRFPILKIATYHTLDSQRDIVTAACALHNFIVNHNGDMKWPANSVPEISPNEFVAIPDGDNNYDGNIESLNNQRQAGALKRDEIAMKMWEDYVNFYRTKRS